MRQSLLDILQQLIASIVDIQANTNLSTPSTIVEPSSPAPYSGGSVTYINVNTNTGTLLPDGRYVLTINGQPLSGPLQNVIQKNAYYYSYP